MTHQQRPTVPTAHLADGESYSRQRRRAPISPLLYSGISGVISLVVGAVASLAASGAVRIALWMIVTAATAIAAGIGYESRLLERSLAAVHRWTHQSGGPSRSLSRFFLIRRAILMVTKVSVVAPVNPTCVVAGMDRPFAPFTASVITSAQVPRQMATTSKMSVAIMTKLAAWRRSRHRSDSHSTTVAGRLKETLSGAAGGFGASGDSTGPGDP
jgi:hypothetical protein